ncbi:MAG: PIN domain-containing protein [Kiritimatiellia bacterium]
MKLRATLVDHAIRNYLRRFFDVMQFIPTTNQLWAESVELAWQLDRKGLVLPSADVLIGAHALKFGAAVLSSDKHFEQVPGLRIYKPSLVLPWSA